MFIEKDQSEELKNHLNMCYKICEKYSWLLDAYVSDFYVQDYWGKLPRCWKDSIKDCSFKTTANIICLKDSIEINKALPLSMLALREAIKYLQIPRKQQTVDIDTSEKVPSNSICDKDLFSVIHFRNVFWKRVKMKKKHEIELMSKMCYKLAAKTDCYNIIDIGSGVGHLSRMLSYGYGLKVCSLEAQEYLTNEARKLDQEMERALKKYCKETPTRSIKPVHINMRVTASSGEDILKIAKEIFGIDDKDDLQFGIVGLHPCGDLGPTLLRFFTNFPQVKFVNIVGCCYMKLSEPTKEPLYGGYPMSDFCKEKNYHLSYACREVACHALEAYVNKLNGNDYRQLKIHAYRAALEKLIVDEWPDLFHSQVSSVKYYEGLSFVEYCFKATSRLGIKINKSKIETKQIEKYLQHWNKVVIFYSLRLMIAPLVETIILLDRILFIIESGSECGVTSIFDPQISPRNQILTAIK